MSDSGSTGAGWDDGNTERPPSDGAPPPPPPSGGGAPPPPPPPPAETTDRTGQAVDIGPRLGARLIDFILLAIVGAIVTSFFTSGADANNPLSFATSLTGFLATVVTAVINVGYFAYLEASRGQTLGKQLLNIRVIGPGGGNPTMEEALKRNLWIAAGIIPFLGGLIELGLVIWIIITITQGADKRGVHDQFAGGTQVVRT